MLDMNNQIFEWRRFGLLIRKHWTDNRLVHLVSPLLIAALILLLWQITVSSKVLVRSNHTNIFLTSFLLLGGAYASITYNALRPRLAGMQYLMLPASTLEKFLVAWVYVYVFFTLTFLLVFYGIDWVMIAIIKASPSLSKQSDLSVFSLSELLEPKYRTILVNTLSIQAIAFLGSVYFERNALVKTFALVAGVMIGTSLLNQLLSHFFFEELVGHVNYTSSNDYLRWEVQRNASLSVSLSHQELNITVLLRLLVILIIWLSAYFRLREKEI